MGADTARHTHREYSAQCNALTGASINIKMLINNKYFPINPPVDTI